MTKNKILTFSLRQGGLIMKNSKTKIDINNTTLKVAMSQTASEQAVIFDLLAKPSLKRPYGRYGKRRTKASTATTQSNHPAKLSPTQERGQAFELQAISFLQSKGLKLIAKNLRCRAGEIDCVMLDKNTLVFVEVRQRSQQHLTKAAASITKEKQRKIKLAACYYLPKLCRHLGLTSTPVCRFDVVTFDGQAHRRQWLRNAFD